MAQVPCPKGFVENPGSLGESLKNYRLIHGKTQREMAQELETQLVSYQQWETSKARPRPRAYSKIVEVLGEYVQPKAESVGETLRFERLTRGLNLAEMARYVGLEPEVWSRLEREIYPPSREEIAKLERCSIFLPQGVVERRSGIPTALSASLRAARQDLKLSQDELAKLLGYRAGSSWSRVENSGRVPCRSKWKQIESILGIDLYKWNVEDDDNLTKKMLEKF